MYDKLDRSAIKALRRQKMSLRKIASVMGCDKKTVMRVLNAPVDTKYERRVGESAIAVYEPTIRKWLENEVPVQRMLELVREDADRPYEGSRSVFYRRVAQLRAAWELERKERFARFEGLPGEYAQIDWGEVRNFPFVKQLPATRYFFAARLKFSRFSFVVFTDNMRVETVIRCLLLAFASFGGVPWICVFDNMKTAVLRRDERGRPVWNEKLFKLMVDVESHPEACWPNSGNQKGSVESLVGWVKENFLPGRVFLDDADLAKQCVAWLDKANGSISQAHGAVPSEVLAEERPKLTKLHTTAQEYGIPQLVVAGPEMLVHIDGNRYQVPMGYVGRSLLARVRVSRVDFYDGDRLVATHQRRLLKQHKPITNPDYCEPLLEKKPRARVMMYRDHLIEQDQSIASFLKELCYRHRGTEAFGPHILHAYELWKEYGSDELGAACAIASEHGAYAAEYLDTLLRLRKGHPRVAELPLPGIPRQEQTDRAMSAYEHYVKGGCV